MVYRTMLLNAEELARLANASPPLPQLSREQQRHYAQLLLAELQTLREALVEACLWETGFRRADCEELVESTLQMVSDVGTERWPQEPLPACSIPYAAEGGARRITYTAAPWGTVAVILPQNACLLLAVTCLWHALAAGNRVILRAPLQSARSATLLAQAIYAAMPDCPAVSVIQARAREFTAALYRSPEPCLMHYFGSSQNAPALLSEAFAHQKGCLIDGEGNTWVWVDRSVNVEQAAVLLTEGAIRYNGQTCTSINGAIIHPEIYREVRTALRARWAALRTGDPRQENVDAGPLFDAEQAEWCHQRMETSGSTRLAGGNREGNLLTPALLECPDFRSDLVREGVFGPILWIMSGTREEFVARWPANRFPLCAGIVSEEADPAWWSLQLPGLARLVINGDPSVECIHEPWGGYPGSGNNPVSSWTRKYQRLVQVDAL